METLTTTTEITENNTKTKDKLRWADGWNHVNWKLYAKLRYPIPNALGVKINTEHLATVLRVRYILDKQKEY